MYTNENDKSENMPVLLVPTYLGDACIFRRAL
jgi:hypothetical protein